MATKTSPELNVEDELLTAMFKSYPELKKGLPSSWVLYSEDWRKHVECFSRVCHSDMKYTTPGYDGFITAVPKDDDTSLSYLRMLIHGPFRAFSDNINLEQRQKHYFLRCTSLDKWPANVLYNFAIASRIPIEHAELLKAYQPIVDIGADPTLAFLLSYQAQFKERFFKGWEDLGIELPSVNAYNTNHMWIDNTSNWSRLINGDMIDFHASYKENAMNSFVFGSSNSIWGRVGADHYNVHNKTLVEISEHFGLKIDLPRPPPEPKPYKKKPGINIMPNGANLEAAIQALGPAPLLMGAVQAPGQVVPGVPGGGVWYNALGIAQPAMADFDAPNHPMHQLDDDDDFEEFLNAELDDAELDEAEQELDNDF